MGFPTFNPFKRERQNFPGVVIPLSEAPLRSRSTSDSENEKKDDSSIDPSKSLDRAPSSETGSAGSIPDSSHLTIEVLRAEIDAEAVTSGQDSMYDRMYPPVCPPVEFSVSSQMRLSPCPEWNIRVRVFRCMI